MEANLYIDSNDNIMFDENDAIMFEEQLQSTRICDNSSQEIEIISLDDSTKSTINEDSEMSTIDASTNIDETAAFENIFKEFLSGFEPNFDEILEIIEADPDETITENIKDNYTCSVCDKAYSRMHKLKQHLKSQHDIELSHKCSQCNKEFPDKFKLKTHVTICHNEKTPKRVGRPIKIDGTLSRSTIKS
jgi:hypothetical protein